MVKDKVKLISYDGFEFVVDYEAACISKTIFNMLSSDGVFTESELGEVQLREVSGCVVEQVCKYFYFHLKYQNTPVQNIPEFKVEPEIVLDMLMAANFLET